MMKKSGHSFVILHRSNIKDKIEIECDNVTMEEIEKSLYLYGKDACGTATYTFKMGETTIYQHNNYGIPVNQDV